MKSSDDVKVSFFKWIKQLKKEQILVLLLLLGLILVVFAPVFEERDEEEVEIKEYPAMEEKTTAQRLEEQLVDTLQQVDGVGMVKAAVTLETSGKKIVEKDGREQESEYSSMEEETVYEKDGDGNQIPYVISEITPQIRGVVVVAQGGGDPVIQQQIQEAVEALFHIEAHKIKVMKMK